MHIFIPYDFYRKSRRVLKILGFETGFGDCPRFYRNPRICIRLIAGRWQARAFSPAYGVKPRKLPQLLEDLQENLVFFEQEAKSAPIIRRFTGILLTFLFDTAQLNQIFQKMVWIKMNINIILPI